MSEQTQQIPEGLTERELFELSIKGKKHIYLTITKTPMWFYFAAEIVKDGENFYIDADNIVAIEPVVDKETMKIQPRVIQKMTFRKEVQEAFLKNSDLWNNLWSSDQQ